MLSEEEKTNIVLEEQYRNEIAKKIKSARDAIRYTINVWLDSIQRKNYNQ